MACQQHGLCTSRLPKGQPSSVAEQAARQVDFSTFPTKLQEERGYALSNWLLNEQKSLKTKFTSGSFQLKLSELQGGRHSTLAMELPRRQTPLQYPPYSIHPESGSGGTLGPLPSRPVSKSYSCVV